MSACADVSDLGVDDNANGGSGNSQFTQACTLIVQRFATCGTAIGCTFTQATITECTQQAAELGSVDTASILNQPCDLTNAVICSDPVYADYCTGC